MATPRIEKQDPQCTSGSDRGEGRSSIGPWPSFACELQAPLPDGPKESPAHRRILALASVRHLACGTAERRIAFRPAYLMPIISGTPGGDTSSPAASVWLTLRCLCVPGIIEDCRWRPR